MGIFSKRNICAELSICACAIFAYAGMVIVPQRKFGKMTPDLSSSSERSGRVSNGAFISDVGVVVEQSDYPKKIFAPKDYKKHLQGICVGGDSIYWSVTDRLLKTDRAGRPLVEIPVVWHHGDCCWANGKVYVAVNLGSFNTRDKADSWVYAYDANLKFLGRRPLPEMCGGAGGMEFADGYFYVVGGAVEGDKVMIGVYTPEFKFVKKIEMEPDDTYLGIQTICRLGDKFLLGCYRRAGRGYTLVTDADFTILKRIEYNSAFGIAPVANAADGTKRVLMASPGRGKLPKTNTFSAEVLKFFGNGFGK